MDEYKLCILSSGIGSRMDSMIGYTHKALISVGGKPVINHILDKIDKDIEIVMSVGYKKELLMEYLLFVYPDRKFKFVEIEKFVGKGTGPGLSLLKCNKYLQCPFVLSTCDTILENYPKLNYNWIGISNCINKDKYCTVELLNGEITKIYEKDKNGTTNAYNGVMYICNYIEFWDSLEKNLTNSAGEIQVSNGWQGLMSMETGLKAVVFDKWYDVGNIESLEITRKCLGGTNNLEKEDESLYFIDNKVIKFFKDPKIIRGRVERSKILSKYEIVPKIIKKSEHFYSYDYINGDVISKIITDDLMYKFLNWCHDTVWKKIELNENKKIKFKSMCQNLHEYKTKDRIQKWFDSKIVIDIPEKINGYNISTTKSLLSRIDWDEINKGIPVLCHGDLHFENIIYTEDEKFICIDWRQDFGGQFEYGDLYYDLCKLSHGLIVNHESVFKNLYTLKKDRNEIYIDIMQSMNTIRCKNIFEKFIKSIDVDFYKVRILTYLVYLNIAILHHSPYNEFLYYLGKLGLYKTLEGVQDDI